MFTVKIFKGDQSAVSWMSTPGEFKSVDEARGFIHRTWGNFGDFDDPDNEALEIWNMGPEEFCDMAGIFEQ